MIQGSSPIPNRPDVAPPSAQDYAKDSKSQAQAQRAGMNVTIANPDATRSIAGDQQDAAEEAGLMFEKFKADEKRLEERKEKNAKKKVIQEIDMANKYVMMAPDMKDPQKLLNFLRSLSYMERPDPDKVLKMVRQSFDDETHQHIALSFAEEMLGQEVTSEALFESVQKAKERLEIADGKAIFTGYQAIPIAYEMEQQGLGDATVFKQAYRDAVDQADNLAQCYTALFQDSSPTEVAQKLPFLYKATQTEVMQIKAFPERAEVENKIGKLQLVRAIHDNHIRAEDLCTKTAQLAQKEKLTLRGQVPLQVR